VEGAGCASVPGLERPEDVGVGGGGVEGVGGVKGEVTLCGIVGVGEYEGAGSEQRGGVWLFLT
jgi:hypothetical protein